MVARPNRSAGLGILGMSRAELAAGYKRLQGETPAPEIVGVKMRPRPWQIEAAAAWGERHRQLAVARLHRACAHELEAGRRWPQPMGLDLATFGREQFVAVLTRLRDGVLPDGSAGPISPVLARIDPETEARGVEADVADETAAATTR